MIKQAEISPCGQYRYTLSRQWNPAAPAVMFIMLNPSTADARQDDPTIAKCIRLAQTWGYGRLLAGNLFAWRSPRPQDLPTAPDPIGPQNDAALTRLAQQAHKIIAAWGNHGSLQNRDRQIRRMFPRRRHALRLNATGQPAHPYTYPKPPNHSC